MVDAVNASVWIGRGAVDTIMERFDLADTFKNRAFARTPAAADVRAYSLAYDATSFRIRRPTGADTSLKKDRPLNVYVQFRLSEDLALLQWGPPALMNSSGGEGSGSGGNPSASGKEKDPWKSLTMSDVMAVADGAKTNLMKRMKEREVRGD